MAISPPIPLSKTRRKWVGQRKPSIMKGSTLRPKFAVEGRYYSDLAGLIERMLADTDRQIKALFEEDHAEEFFAQDASLGSQSRILTNHLMRKFNKLFSLQSGVFAERFAINSDRAARSALTGSLRELSGGLTLNPGAVITGKLKDVLTATIAENVQLIKSIPQKYFLNIQGAVMRSITTGNGAADLVPYLHKQTTETLWRARVIAADQTRKAFSTISKIRMDQMGVQEFEWIHSGGGLHPRELHRELDGKIFRMDDPPIIQHATKSLAEVRGFPGQLINCRCTMKPVVKFD